MNKIRAELIKGGHVKPAPAHAAVREAVRAQGHNDVQAAKVKKAIAILQAVIERARTASGENHVR